VARWEECEQQYQQDLRSSKSVETSSDTSKPVACFKELRRGVCELFFKVLAFLRPGHFSVSESGGQPPVCASQENILKSQSGSNLLEPAVCNASLLPNNNVECHERNTYPVVTASTSSTEDSPHTVNNTTPALLAKMREQYHVTARPPVRPLDETTDDPYLYDLPRTSRPPTETKCSDANRFAVSKRPEVSNDRYVATNNLAPKKHKIAGENFRPLSTCPASSYARQNQPCSAEEEFHDLNSIPSLYRAPSQDNCEWKSANQPKVSTYEHILGLAQSMMTGFGLMSAGESLKAVGLKPIGLVNRDGENLCFFNAVLQLLAWTPGLREKVQGRNELAKSSNNGVRYLIVELYIFVNSADIYIKMYSIFSANSKLPVWFIHLQP